MRATHSKKVGTGSNKRPEKLNVHIRNSWRTSLQLSRSIGNMIGYKKSLSEWQCLSEVKMGRGSPIPPMLRRKIVEQYQKAVSQRKIAKSLKLSSSTVHNIIQRFRESGTISVRKGRAVPGWRGARCEVWSGAPLGPFAMALRGGGAGFDSVRRGARGPVRPHQLHRPKDGPA